MAAAAALIFTILAVTAIALKETSGSTPPRVFLHALNHQRSTIYHSPQVPGYTAWTGAWILPDRSLMVAFTQASGPVDPAQRTLAPPSLLRKMRLTKLDPRKDFWGLDLSVKYLRSTDEGATWHQSRSDSFKTVFPHGYTPQASIALRDGTLVRRVNGYDLRYDESIPHTAYLQRLPRGAKEWSPPQVLLNPARYTYQLSRLRRLRDGRLVGLGNFYRAPAGSPPSTLRRAPVGLLLMVSSDEGRTWANRLTVPPKLSLSGEWDAAELPGGDLLGVIRAYDPARPGHGRRRQGIMEKRGEGWVLKEVRNSPLAPSGHPELLATSEGPVLHIATTGAHYTDDRGRTWRRLRFSPELEYKSRYYPRTVQANDGTVYVFSHLGWDNGYGETDQSIVMDRFQLVKEDPTALGVVRLGLGPR